jgi:pimeloyl-ACP methyl ester carboxylesterase
VKPTEKDTEHPYPPDVLPGGRDVQTPYGNIHVFEWGPEEGDKVLLIHGIGTPCLALADLAERLVDSGHRVMLFDLFGRGYSDAPVDIPYDIRLYTSQILLVLASSSLPWTGDDGFHLMGYSLGGALAVSFTQYYSHMIRSLTVVAGGGLIRNSHVSWRSKLLYSTGIFPERLLEYLIYLRLSPKNQTVTEVKVATEAVQEVQGNSDASGGSSFDDAVLSRRRPGQTVAAVMGWQIRQHCGFVPAFMSSIRHAPIYERRHDWAAVGDLLSSRRAAISHGKPIPGLRGGRMLVVLGETDPVIVRQEFIQDAEAVLGDGFEVVLLDCGHEIAITRGHDVAEAAIGFWNRHK